MSIAKETRFQIRRLLLAAKIAKKWTDDSLQLPLVEAHKNLYEIIHIAFWRKFRRFPNLIRPADYNDRIQWLKLFYQHPDIPRCSDKIEVRGYVAERVGGSLLTKLYATFDSAIQFDWVDLPESFVVKTNHDSGSVFLIKEKSRANLSEIKNCLRKALAKSHGYSNGEWGYLSIKPRVLVEEYIGTPTGKRPSDFKFHCVDGRVRWLQYIYDRGLQTKEIICDEFGCPIADLLLHEKFLPGIHFSKPSRWNDLIAISEALAEGWKYVRVDLYCEGDRIIFGEMTFHPMAGLYEGKGQIELGRLMDFDLADHIPPNFCKR